MLCTINTGRLLACKDNVGSIRNIYFADYGTLGALTISGGEITAIAGTPDIYKYEVRGANSLEVTVTQSADNGTTYYEQALTVTLQKLDADTTEALNSIIIGRPHVFIEDNNGKFYSVGVTRGCDTTGGTFATGAAFGDLSGYTLNLTASEPFYPYQVVSTVISANLDTTNINPA
ncbi:MAG: hypothetical protein ACOVK2_04370 [Candidatus Fonsibacter sp.]